MQFHIENMACGGCVRSITKVIESMDPQAKIEADLTTRLVSVVSEKPREAFLSVLEDAGFPAAIQ